MYLSSIDLLNTEKLKELSEINEGYFILVAAKHIEELGLLISKFNQFNIRFFGGVFPKLISGINLYDEGLLLISLPLAKSKVLQWDSMLAEDSDIEHFLPKENQSAILITDAAYGQNSSAIRKMFKGEAHGIQIVGGGAGLLSLEKKACIFNNTGLFKNAGILAVLDSKLQTGISHGWEPVGEPMLATHTVNNVIVELNWEKAINVYARSIEEVSGKIINASNFQEIAKSFPLGIYKAGHEYIVRDPFKLGINGELICIAEVPENSAVHLLYGNKNSLLNAAKKAASTSVTHITPTHGLVFDCISRMLYLDHDYPSELNTIEDTFKPFEIEINGACVIGEICQETNTQIEFFNKTVIVASLY